MDAWKPTLEAGDRVREIVDFISSADYSVSRFKGFGTLEMFDDAVVGAALRELLDGPLAGNAALYLLARGLADEQEVGGLVDIGVFVDVLASSVDDPDELCEMFANAPQTADQYAALEQMRRHPAAETPAVLDALGKHLPTTSLPRPPARRRSNTAVGWPTDTDPVR